MERPARMDLAGLRGDSASVGRGPHKECPQQTASVARHPPVAAASAHKRGARIRAFTVLDMCYTINYS